MYSIIFIYVSLIGNRTVRQQKIQAILEISRGGGGVDNFAWPRIFN